MLPRRTIFGLALLTAALGLNAVPLVQLELGTNLPPARVVIVENPQATVFFRPQPEVLRVMVDRAIIKLTGKPTGAAAWSSLVSPMDVVGLKVYSAPGPIGGTRPAVVAAVVEGLLAAGLQPTNIIVWDKRRADLAEAGFPELANRYGIRVESSEAAGYDQDVFYENSLLGSLIWGDMEFGKRGDIVGRNSYVSKLVSRDITKIINVTPLLNNNYIGVTGHLYSLAFGSVDNTARFEFDSERLATAVPEIYAVPAVGDRVVLNITDALLCQYEGSQRGLLHYTAVLNQLWFSRDPVALDVLALQEIERQRRLADAPAQRISPELYRNASLLELGVSNTNHIHVEKIQ